MTIRFGLLAAATMIVATAGVAHAADLIIEQPPVEVAPAAVDWSGPYVGLHVGFGKGQIGNRSEVEPQLAGFATFAIGEDEAGYDLSGWLAGAQVGGYAQFGSFVLGLQGDVSWSDLNGIYSFNGNPGNPDDTATIDWLASLTARGGVAFDSVLLYGLAGIAMAGGSSDFFGDVQDLNFTGFTVGVGAALKLDDNWSVFGEYAYSGFGDIDVTYEEFTSTYDLDISTFKVGVNYAF